MLRTRPRARPAARSERPSGRPYRRLWALPVLALGTALLAVGVIRGDGLLLAAGLVVMGLAGQRCDRSSADRHRPPPSQD